MGLPPTAGFMAKFLVFSQAVDSGLLWLVIIAVINSVVSVYFYLRVVRVMWLDKPIKAGPVAASLPPRLVLAVSALGILLLGLAPFWALKLADFGSKILLP